MRIQSNLSAFLVSIKALSFRLEYNKGKCFIGLVEFDVHRPYRQDTGTMYLVNPADIKAV